MAPCGFPPLFASGTIGKRLKLYKNTHLYILSIQGGILMSSRLHEAKADLELAVIKALNSAQLTVDEINSLKNLSIRDLLVDHDLDHVLANRVLGHLRSEEYRMNAQNLETPIEDYSSTTTSLRRSWPINEGNHLSVRELNQLIHRMISEESGR